MTIDELYQIIEGRKKEMPNDSYVASLFRDGTDRIVQKVGEEATEVVIAAKNDSREKVISEIADLWFHTLIILAEKNIKPSEIFHELQKRHEKKF